MSSRVGVGGGGQGGCEQRLKFLGKFQKKIRGGGRVGGGGVGLGQSGCERSIEAFVKAQKNIRGGGWGRLGGQGGCEQRLKFL